MAIATKMTEVQNGITFGYSDTCNTLFGNGDWTASELARFSWCRWNDRYTNCVSATTIDTGSWQGAAVCNLLSYFQNNGGDLKTKYVDDRIPTQQPYAFNILMYGRDGDLCLNSSNAANYRVVTSCSDFQKLYVQVDEYKSSAYTRNVQHPTTRSIDVNRLLWSSEGVYNTDNNQYTSYITVWTVLVLDENTFFVTRGMGFPNREPCIYDGSFGSAQQNFRPSNSIDLDNTPTDDKWKYSSTQITTYDETKYLLRWYKNGLTGIDEDIWTAQDQYGCWDVDNEVSVIMHGSWGNYQYTYALRSEDAVKNAIAYTGLRWKYRIGDTTHIYTPIIDDEGFITGYSTDPDAETKLNDIIDVTGNNISPFPPSPPGPAPGPYDDDPWNGVSFSGVSVGGAGAFAKCYYMTSTELANLRTWMSGVGVPEGFDPMAQIIGLSQVPVALSGDAPNETVKFINSSAVYDPGVTSRVVDSGVTTEQAMGTPIKYSLGSVDISRRMQERGEPYLDYDSQVELYLPLIGVFSLDTQAVMGRTIEAEAILDPISGTLAAYAWVSKDGQKLPIAYGSTTIGVDLPITAQQYSVAKAALKQANAQLATALLSSALTMIASASASGKASQSGGRTGVSAPSGIQQASNNSFSQAAGIAASQTMVSQTGNVFGTFMDWGRTIRQLSYGNNTAIAGSFGGSSAQWSYPFQAYVKIIRPRFVKPDNYAHTQGVPCVQAKKIKNCTGFIQCIGVDVINIAGATDLERQAIQAALSSGIYAGGGQ